MSICVFFYIISVRIGKIIMYLDISMGGEYIDELPLTASGAAYAINCALIHPSRSIHRDPTKLLLQLTGAFYVAFVNNRYLVSVCLRIKLTRLKWNAFTVDVPTTVRRFGLLNVFGCVLMRVLIACSASRQCVCVCMSEYVHRSLHIE